MSTKKFTFRNPFVLYTNIYRIRNNTTNVVQINKYHYAAFAAGNMNASRTIRGGGYGPNGSNTFLMNLYGR